MSDKDKLDDDEYVAKLLAEDARKSSHRYAAAGLSALLPRRPQQSAAKPNTRFLNHIVREADNHNAALKRKEELEASIKLREMRNKGRPDRNKHDEDDRASKRRRLDAEGGRKRGRHEQPQDRSQSSSPRREERSSHRVRGDRREAEHRRSRHDSYGSYGRPHRSERRCRKFEESDADADRPRSRASRPSQSVSNHQLTEYPGSESDPLEDLVGPLPRDHKSFKSHAPICVRGRGAGSATKSNIDAHFAPTYDPASDIHPDDELTDEREDWDMALEALRDRVMWKRKQTDRMREAGFGDEDIEKWERKAASRLPGDDSSRNGKGTKVKWAKKGEEREWDMGKQPLNN